MMSNIHTHSPQQPQPSQPQGLFEGSTEWVHGAAGEGQQINYERKVQVVVRAGNCWKTADREYRGGEQLEVTLGELAAHPMALQTLADAQAEQARNAMLRPAQEAASRRAEQMRQAVQEQLQAVSTPEQASRESAARREWQRQQARAAKTPAALATLLAASAISQELHDERLRELGGNPAVAPQHQQRAAETMAAVDPAGGVASRDLKPSPIADRLVRLGDLFARNLITKDSYERRQAEILAEV